MYLWSKRVRPEQADAWTVRLQPAVDAARLAVVAPVGGRLVRLEVYCDTETEARGLVGQFGGQARVVPAQSWQPAPATAPGKPLRIGGRLSITGRPEELADLHAAHPGAEVLCIPAAMAFGTGEHATTAMCLRLLMDVAHARVREPWEVLDLGTGSGILALAGVRLGARRACGFDNDPHAVRTAKANARLNGIGARRAWFGQADLTANWPAQGQAWPVVTANLFSELLIRLMPGVIAPAVASGGDLILSGVLGTQADEVVGAVRAAGFALIVTKSRGRWRAFHCRRD